MATGEAVAKIAETVISELGAIFRNLKVGLFISRDSYWCTESQHQHSASAFYFFTLLFFTFQNYLFTFNKLSLYLIIYTRARQEIFSAHL